MDYEIFVSVASLGDPETENTIKSIIENADNPVRVCASVQTDDHELIERLRQIEHCDVADFGVVHARGPCFARAFAQSWYNGEPWYFQCDSHTRMMPGWDTMCIDWLKDRQEKSAITFYVAHERQHRHISVIDACQWDHDGMGHSRAEVDAEEWHEPIPARFVGGGFLFAPGRIVTEVPYDPYGFFFGEEQSLALRLYTHGWDLYHAPGIPAVSTCQDAYPRIWDQDVHRDWTGHLHGHAMRRVNTLFGRFDGTDAHLGPYGLGTERTLQDWIEWSGCDPLNNIIEKDADWRIRHGFDALRMTHCGCGDPIPGQVRGAANIDADAVQRALANNPQLVALIAEAIAKEAS